MSVGLDKARPRASTASVVLRGTPGRHLLVSDIRTCDGTVVLR